MEELDKKVSEIVRSTVKEFMESLMKGEIQAFLEENRGSRDGYYGRNLKIANGRIHDLSVPRDQNNGFQITLTIPCFNGFYLPKKIDGLRLRCAILIGIEIFNLLPYDQ